MLGRVLAASTALALYLVHAWFFGAYVADDAAISLAYARNLVDGFGPVLYPGGEAVEGFSNPLWTAVLAVFSAVGLDGGHGIALLKGLGLATGAAVLVLTVQSRRVLYPADTAAIWLAPALLAVWTSFVFWSGAGLENPLYALLLLAATALQLRELDTGDRRPLSAIALLGVALTRPEGVAFFIPFLLHRVLLRQPIAKTMRWMVVFLIPFAVFLAVRHAVFGDLAPNTYHAKISDRSLRDLPYYLLTPSDAGPAYVGSFVLASVPVSILAAAGLLDPRAWRTNVLVGGICSGMALYAVYAGGDFWPEWRFLTGVLPLLALAAQHGVQVIARERRVLAAALASVCLAALADQSVHRTREVRRLSDEGWFVSLQGRLEQAQRIRALADRYGIADPLYADPDIGGPSVAGLRVLDLAGLADVHIARFHYYPAFFRDYIFKERRPHIIRTHGPWTRNSRITEFPEFHEQYVAVSSRRDEDGLHGEFIRRDLVEGPGPADASPRAGASFSQAVADRRARRAREDARERDGWIEYYVDRGYHARLRRAYEEHAAAGTLPVDHARLRQLSSGLLAAGDVEGARQVLRLIHP
jgi:hypothetical protein